MGKANVQALRPREGAVFDQAQLGDIVARMADQHGYCGLGEVLDDLALRLSQIGPAWRDARFEQIEQHCRAVADIATEMRLDRLARVAHTAVALSAQSDGVALAANLGRMMRLGEALLMEIWQLQDASV